MIELNKYYRIQTEFGERTIKALENTPGGMYGIYSPSNYLVSGDNQGSLIPENSTEASSAQAIAWNTWYNQ